MRRGWLVLVLVLGACGGGDDDEAGDATTTTTTTTTAAAGGGGAVSVQNSSFAPPAVSVKVGDKVTWTFRDSVSHTATAEDGSFDSGNKSSDATFEHTFARAGTFAYKCRIHSAMTGRVVVT